MSTIKNKTFLVIIILLSSMLSHQLQAENEENIFPPAYTEINIKNETYSVLPFSFDGIEITKTNPKGEWIQELLKFPDTQEIGYYKITDIQNYVLIYGGKNKANKNNTKIFIIDITAKQPLIKYSGKLPLYSKEIMVIKDNHQNNTNFSMEIVENHTYKSFKGKIDKNNLQIIWVEL